MGCIYFNAHPKLQWWGRYSPTSWLLPAKFWTILELTCCRTTLNTGWSTTNGCGYRA
jgi:hypothetical protein